MVGYVTWTAEDMEATSQNEQVFFIENNSLTLSQQVSLRRHCTGSLQNRVWRRLFRMSRWMWSSKLWHYLFGHVQPRRRPSALLESMHKQICGERTYLSLKFNFFLKLNSIMGSVEHLAKWWLMSNNNNRSNRHYSDACLRYFCDG